MMKLFFAAKISVCLFVILGSQKANAQQIAVSTNLVGWATLSPNAGIEFVSGNHFTFATEFSVNPFHNQKYQLKHLSLSLSAKYWPARPFAKHCIGITTMAATYDIMAKKYRYNGDMVSLGLSYGYSFLLSDHWNFETSIGGGYALRKEFPDPSRSLSKIYKGYTLTKLGFSFIYIIR